MLIEGENVSDNESGNEQPIEISLIARVFPLQIESVELALNVLDGYELRGKKIAVQRAEFQMRGEYNPTLKPRVRKHEKEKMKKMQQK